MLKIVFALPSYCGVNSGKYHHRRFDWVKNAALHPTFEKSKAQPSSALLP
jgi:hypothetical protein